MSTVRATRHVLERLAAGSGVLLAVLLDLGEVPAWCDGRDAEGRAVLLVGRHQLGSGPEATEAVARILGVLAEGSVPEDIHVVAYQPAASRALAEIVAGRWREVLVDGPRGTGKTQMTPAALGALAEMRARAGESLPLRVLWVHDSLKSAGAKTAASLEQPHWTGLWGLRADTTRAVLTVGGVEMVVADFVATTDPTAKERLKAESHMVLAEEVIPSLGESAGVDEKDYELALTSARLLPNRRGRLGVIVTNPGAPDSWPALRFGLEGHLPMPGTVRCQIPASDRMTVEQIAEQEALFRNDPEQQARLARGEWVELVLGEKVTPTFAGAHIAPGRLHPRQGAELLFGHDAGHTPTTVIGARVNGHVEIYACLVSLNAGTVQHIEQTVRPWLATHAPSVLANPSLMRHWYDPNMDTGEQANIDQSPLRVMREKLGGTFLPGMVKWEPRLEPVTALLAQFNGATGRPVLQIDPVEAALLIRSFRGGWHYPTVNGRISRDAPKKPNHPYEDAGDAACYLIGGLAPSAKPRPKGKPLFARTGANDPYGLRRARFAESATAIL